MHIGRKWMVGAAVLFMSSLGRSTFATVVAEQGSALALNSPPTTQPAGQLPETSLVPPVRLAIIDEPESVYPQAIAQEPTEPGNMGSVNFDLKVSYLTRYVFRGVDQATIETRPENSLQFDGSFEFDLGKLPHPFVGLFVNVFNNDPIARFEEVRPTVGLRWTIKPLTLTGAYVSYIYPNRKSLDTEEALVKLSWDDSRLWNRDTPMFSPYFLAAYDFERYFGTYLEFGVMHNFVIEETGLTLTPSASIAYVVGDPYFRKTPTTTATGQDTGFQHYEFGLTLDYSLNNLLNISRRFGQWSIRGYIFDDSRISRELRADNRLFGGGGIEFKY